MSKNKKADKKVVHKGSSLYQERDFFTAIALHAIKDGDDKSSRQKIRKGEKGLKNGGSWWCSG